jgi:type I restriction enzyme R subunit
VSRTEKETRDDLITPQLRLSEWTPQLVEEEFLYRKGRVRLIGEQPIRDDPQYIDYLLREAPLAPPLAVVEAKDESHSIGSGLQQAMAYAADVGAPFAYSSNGRGIVEFDSLSLKTLEIERFPRPNELIARRAGGPISRGPEVMNRRGKLVSNPAIAPAVPGSRLRYYQERAVAAALDEVLKGRHRALLSLATGTGKTLIAYNVIGKLLASGYYHRALFLADRVSLRNQAYNEFAGLGYARGIVDGPDLPLQHTVHFAIYQGLFAQSVTGRRVFEDYPRDFFDIVVIDECHRSGYGDWAEILDYFSSAFHLGLTATPKRTDSIDTYETFAGENLDATGSPLPAYEYSLGQGIDDGFLATYRVHRIETNIDKAGLLIGQELARGAELIVPEGANIRDAYVQTQFEREIVVPDRTRLLCEHLATLLRRFGVYQKTIVFCVTAEHADQVRTHMQELLGPDTGKALYAVRIVGEERDAQSLLAEFQLSSSTEPVLATTVDLLTTGVDAPSVRNIVFMKPVSSTTVFKQIIGRGTRLDPATGKEFFRIIDYTNATRLFDTWDIPSSSEALDPASAFDGVLAGSVVDAEARRPMAGAFISIRRGLRLVAESVTVAEGSFSIHDLPREDLNVVASAAGYRKSEILVDLRESNGTVNFELELVREPIDRIVIHGIEIRIAAETELVLGDGSQLTVEQYVDRVGERVRTQVGDLGTLEEMWRDPHARARLRVALAAGDVDPALLAILLNRPDADEFDLLANVAFESRVRTRDERARVLMSSDSDWRQHYSEEQLEIISALIDMYRVGGVDEISTSDAFRALPLDRWGGVRGLIEVFGSSIAVGQMLRELQDSLYADGGVAA